MCQNSFHFPILLDAIPVPDLFTEQCLRLSEIILLFMFIYGLYNFPQESGNFCIPVTWCMLT
jgi:hypothetical protein